MNKYRKEYCKENGSVKINPENTKLYDYIKHLENKLEQAEQLTLTDVVSSVDFEKPTFREMREEVLSNQLWSEQNELYRHFKWGTKTLREAYEIATS